MEFLKRLLGGRSGSTMPQPTPPPTARPVAERRISITEYGGDRFVAIDELDLMGQKSLSPDGRLFVVAESLISGGDGGPRDGAFAVVEGGTLRATGTAQRPQDAKIANSGAFIVNDWLHSGDLAGCFLGFHADGSPAFAHHFSANLGCNGISADGRIAACQTYNAPNSPDSCIVAVFDLDTGAMIGRFTPASTNARGFEFDTSAGHIHLLTQDGDRQIYRYDGDMIDRAGWRDRRISRGDLLVIGDAVRELEVAPVPPADPAMVDRLLAGIAAAKSNGQAWEQARACRLEGELRECLGDVAGALMAYDAALLLDPQVGVSRKADRLRRALGGSSAPAKRRGRTEQQAERLGIRHETITLESDGPKSWRFAADAAFVSVERAALDHYLDAGWSGAAAEGGLMLTLIKAASFVDLPPRSADTFIEALYAQNVAFDEDRYPAERLIATIATADLDRLRRNWRVISATAGASPAFYPQVHWEAVEGLFRALGRERLAAIATIFATAPYDLRAGWPDLTLWRGSEVRFAEVKAPSDQMHASQARLISTLLRPLGFDVALVEIQKRGA